ncbi:hypothetical protein QR665_05580 [Acinetobacter gerneri]|uniref:hypothetical protein n=1 Tax=Acinetobacter gerneri TaxID=202952 RepID=UPI002936B16D|nr:hypothetical protein [Acinetobacter gerneri]MDV2438959.1 hypothetical protein [Acinetobacter gerneri]
MQFDAQSEKYIPSVKTVPFAVEDAPQNTWLAHDPVSLLKLCEAYNVSAEEGCKVSLALYPNQEPEWVYHLGFGVYRK